MKKKLSKSNMFVIYAFCTLIVYTSVVAEPVTVEFGEDCDGVDKQCDDAAFQVCDKLLNKCQCKNPDKTFYDKENKICRIRAKEACEAKENAQPCTRFSDCTIFDDDTGGIAGWHCECDPNLIELRGQCFVDIDKDCSDPTKGICDTESFIVCNDEKKCACAEYNGIWYQAATKSCALLEGANCTTETGAHAPLCVESAKCNTIGADVEGNCACLNGVTNSISRRCVAYHGEKCGQADKVDCKKEDYISCVSGECTCAGGDDVRFNDATGVCELLEGAKCKVNGQTCTAFAQCPHDDGVCTCNEGLTRNKNKECYLSYGDKCQEVPWGWFCDPANNLDCSLKTKTCECRSPSETHFENGVCKIRARMPCKKGDPDAQQCIENARCWTVLQHEICVCDDPMVPNAEFLCARKYNTTCGKNLAGDCNAIGFQTCNNGKCECLDPITMDPTEDGLGLECAVRMNSTCKVGDGNAPCGNRLACGSTGKCECDSSKGLALNGYGKCARLQGTPCKFYDGLEGLCDTDAYLTCRTKTETCECDDDHMIVQEGKGKTCVGNLNAPCKTDANCNSQESLVCNLETNMCDSGIGRLALNFELMVLAFLFATVFKYFD